VKFSPILRDFVQTVDDREWQKSLYELLQNQTYNQCEVDLFELMCKVLDQNLFSQVDWARNSVFFKDLKVGARPLNLPDSPRPSTIRCSCAKSDPFPSSPHHTN
jgi:hypothetical protein